jgi:hypothetical protein
MVLKQIGNYVWHKITLSKLQILPFPKLIGVPTWCLCCIPADKLTLSESVCVCVCVWDKYESVLGRVFMIFSALENIHLGGAWLINPWS